MCFIKFGCHQRWWEVNPAEGSDNWSWGHTLHWRRLWVRYLLPHQIPCGPTKGFHHYSSLLFTKTNISQPNTLLSHQGLSPNITAIIVTGLLQNNWKWISAFQPKPLQLWEGKDEVFNNNNNNKQTIWPGVPLFAGHLGGGSRRGLERWDLDHHSSEFTTAERPVSRYYRPLVDIRPFCLNGWYSSICGQYYIKMVDILSNNLSEWW